MEEKPLTEHNEGWREEMKRRFTEHEVVKDYSVLLRHIRGGVDSVEKEVESC